jgi:hypothetical protein
MMALTERELMVFQEISDWEEKLFTQKAGNIQAFYDKWLDQGFSMLPSSAREQFFSKFDSWLFHLNAIIQGSQIQSDARDSILTTGRIFNPEITVLEDMKRLSIDQLIYIADQQIAKHRLYSFTQGGISGTGEALLLGSDIPAIAFINVRLVQLIAMVYGYEVNTPVELMIALKAFHGGTMPKRMQKEMWQELLLDIEGDDPFFYQGKEELTNISWLEQPARQMFKAAAIALFRKRLIKGIPLISMVIGGASNYRLTRNVSEFAHHFYQYRFLKEKKEYER